MRRSAGRASRYGAPVWQETHGTPLLLAEGQANHCFWRASRESAAARGFQPAAKAGMATRRRNIRISHQYTASELRIAMGDMLRLYTGRRARQPAPGYPLRTSLQEVHVRTTRRRFLGALTAASY